jgi:hypothetical protein
MTHDSTTRRAEVTAYAASVARQPGTLGYLLGSAHIKASLTWM